MQPVWHRVRTVSFGETCLNCKYAVARRALERIKGATSIASRVQHRYNTSLATLELSSADTANNNGTTGNDAAAKEPEKRDERRMFLDMLDKQQLRRDKNVKSDRFTTHERSKTDILSEFHKALATQDIDCIWPKYNYLFHHKLLHHLSHRAYHQIFLYIIRGRATQKNLSRLLTVVDDMKSQGIELWEIEYNALMHWIGGRSVPKKRTYHLTEALALFNDMQKKGNLKNSKNSLVAYNTLIYIASQVSEVRIAKQLYHDLVAKGLQPDAYTYSILLTSLGRMGDVEGIERILDQLQQMKHVTNSTVIWNAVISAYAMNGIMDKATSMFNDMHSVLRWKWSRGRRRQKTDSANDEDDLVDSPNAPPADEESFRIYIEAKLREKRIDEALRLLDEMIQYGLRPNAALYNSFFACFVKPDHDDKAGSASYLGSDPTEKAAHIDIVRRLYRSMENLQITPNSDTMYTLVSALLDLGDIRFALETFAKLSNQRINSSTTISEEELLSQPVASLAKQRLKLDTKRPSKIEPRQELLDRLQDILLAS